jgi:hypothetical protein
MDFAPRVAVRFANRFAKQTSTLRNCSFPKKAPCGVRMRFFRLLLPARGARRLV